jgi:two-component system, cell cycle sensor histidine kinase and response regulator CckA
MQFEAIKTRSAHQNTTRPDLQRIGRLSTHETTAESLLQRAANLLTEITDFPSVCIVHAKGNELPPLSEGTLQGAQLQQMFREPQPGRYIQRSLRGETALLDNNAQQPQHITENTLALPLYFGQKLFGVMFLEVPADNTRPPEEAVMLQELADDLALALHGIERDRALQEQEELLRETSRLAKIGGWKFEIATERGAWTEEAARVFDVEINTLMTVQSTLNFFQGESRTKIEAALQEALTLGKSFDLELELLSAKGVRKWIRSIGKPEATNGECTHLRGTFQDISERKMSEATLLSERTLLRTVLNTIPDLVWLKDPAGAYLACNRHFEALYGAKEADIVGKTAFDFVEPEQASTFQEHDQRVLRLQEASISEVSVTFQSDGHRELIEAIKTPMYDELGCLIGILGIGRDVTERRRIAEELQTTRERYRSLVDNLEDIVFSLNANQQVTFINQAISRLGYTPEELIGRCLDGMIHPEDLALLQRDRTSDKTSRTNEVRLINPSGKIYPFRAMSRVTVENDMVVGVTVVLRDLTLQRETEEQLRAAQKMEAVGRLAGGVAHDFNNLLSVILSYAEMSVMSLRKEDPLRTDLEEIAGAAIKGGRLTQQLLAFSKRQVLQPEVLSINDLTTNLAKMLGRLIGEDISLKVSITEALDKIKADRGQIEQVVMNLAVNARDAMPHGGLLELLVTVQELTLSRAALLEVPPGEYVVLSVVDTGFGMDTATRARIFEPFFTTKGSGKGTGLGLSTVYGIIKQSDGGIEVESELGKGSTFRIYLPQYKEGQATEKSTAAQPIVRGQETILVVEDEPSLRSVIRRSLSSAGYNVLSAANANEALLLGEMKRKLIKLVLTDIVMPGMNGRELVEKMAAVCPAAKILYTSGHTDSIEAQAVLGSNFLRKPFDWQTLVRKVRESLDAP